MKRIFRKKFLEKECYLIRRKILESAYTSGGGQHLGGGLSMVEIMSYLYGYKLNIDTNNLTSIKRDRFILSKGHGVLGFYPVLNYYGLIPDDIFKTYKTQYSELISHPIKNYNYGIESSNGSLGHGLSYGLGIAHGLKINNINSHVYVLIGDGECNEGSIWEAAMSGSSLGIDNLTLIIDYNKYQSDGATSEIINQSDLSKRWDSFGWKVIEIDGHNLDDINQAFNQITTKKIPKLILANTVKGKGINFMENNNQWHHGRLTENIFHQALEALENEYAAQ